MKVKPVKRYRRPRYPDRATLAANPEIINGCLPEEFEIGDVRSGIDPARRRALYDRSQAEEDACRGCEIRSRCEHRCSCLNWQTTGSIDRVSPLVCQCERILTPIVDRLGERLFRKRAPLFIQKHYNASYPLLSYVEDQIITT